MIIPVILEQDFTEVKRKISLVENVADLIQIDIADGKLVRGTTFLDVFGLDEIETSSVFELHLMVEKPLDFVQKRLKKVIKICTQIEVSPSTVKEFISKSKELGYKVGLSLKKETAVTTLQSYLAEIDYVQFVAVEAGGQNRLFDSHILTKIKELKKLRPHMYIQVDGGVDEENLINILKAGANGAVIGSHIFESKNPEQAVLRFKELEKEHAHTI